jgi:hypothetical protein
VLWKFPFSPFYLEHDSAAKRDLRNLPFMLKSTSGREKTVRSFPYGSTLDRRLRVWRDSVRKFDATPDGGQLPLSRLSTIEWGRILNRCGRSR